MKDFEVTQYLSRIKLHDCSIDFAGLSKLQQSHLLNVPFENLDVVVDRAIDLNSEKLFKKIVQSNRGGYCFELNTIYSLLLKSLGFSIKPVLGRVWLRNPPNIPPRNHLAHLVKLKGDTFITDVGFGGLTTRVPLSINDSSEINDNDGIVRIIPFKTNQFMVQRKIENGWANQYSFDNLDISQEDIEISNFYMSTNPKSHFYKDRFIGLFMEEGRIGLFNKQLSIRKGIKVVDRKEFPYGSKWIDILKNQFNIQLDFTKQEIERLFKTD